MDNFGICRKQRETMWKTAASYLCVGFKGGKTFFKFTTWPRICRSLLHLQALNLITKDNHCWVGIGGNMSSLFLSGLCRKDKSNQMGLWLKPVRAEPGPLFIAFGQIDDFGSTMAAPKPFFSPVSSCNVCFIMCSPSHLQAFDVSIKSGKVDKKNLCL